MSDTFKMKPTRSKTIWQFRRLGTNYWCDCLNKSHAEERQRSGAWIRETIVLQELEPSEQPPTITTANGYL